MIDNKEGPVRRNSDRFLVSQFALEILQENHRDESFECTAWGEAMWKPVEVVEL